ncbi:uncharacterized protein V6R79_004845 [Siganus canaliculatus]
MYSSLSPNLVRPHQPLRKPSSSPMAFGASPPPTLAMPGVSPIRPAPEAIGDGLLNSPLSRDASALTGIIQASMSPCFCHFCGQKGMFRCKRCKKTSYCSVRCQTENWNAHRHVCKPVDSEPAILKPKEPIPMPVKRDEAGLLGSTGESSNHQRLYFKDLQLTQINKGTNIQASVVEFYSPARFFVLVQSPELLEAMQSISTELQKTYSCQLPGTTYAPCVGEVCAVQFSCDQNWYRGLVQSLTTDQKMASILYIDFGNEELVPVDRIKPLTAKIPPFCPCAMECRIAGVVPAGRNWSVECCVTVKQMLAGKTATVKLVETLENGRIHVVDFLLSTGKQLSTLLIENGYGVQETVNTAFSKQDINALMSAALDNYKRCSLGKDDNTWAKPPEPLTETVGDSFSVMVTHLKSPSEIIVQKVENAGAIQELQMKLRDHCSQIQASQDFRPAPGTVCCAQFSEDRQWYRAKVLAYSSVDRVCVGYLDFGNSEEVDLSHLRPISRALLDLPMQAIPCCLAGVQPVEESWSQDSLSALQRLVAHRILRVDIQQAHEGKALVVMTDENSDPQTNVAELLKCAGLAAPSTVAFVTDEQLDQTPPAAPVEPQASTQPSLVWSCTELPSDGQTVLLLASVVTSPQEFYCHINTQAAHQQLFELTEALKRHCESQATPFKPEVGNPCCVMYPDNKSWYRGLVKELSEDKVSVFFVDFGHKMDVEKAHVRAITPQLLALPFQAVRCSLAGVEPLGSEWSSEALLWFQTLVVGKELSAQVLSVSEQGYDLKLEGHGQDVAAALISEQLAKAPGASPGQTLATTCSAAAQQDISENKNLQLSHTQAAEIKDEVAVSTSEVPSFPVDWKTLELPLNETFQPYIAAIISPSLFYLLSPSQVDQQKLQGVMMELATYCNTKKTSSSFAVTNRPVPGAACCAQFTADNNWYRAVVLEVCENDTSVIYADYGNMEKVPLSRIMPISTHLLQLPFQITRCSLAGKECFPAEWPQEVLQTFQKLLQNGVLATVQSFDGSANVLSLTLPTEKGGGHVTAMLLDAVQVQNVPCPPGPQMPGQTDSSTSANTTVTPDCPQPKSLPETQMALESSAATTDVATTPEPAAWTPQQMASTVTRNEDPVKKIVEQLEPHLNTESSDLQTSGCCCLSLKTKIKHLEQLMHLQLSLLEQLVGQKK